MTGPHLKERSDKLLLWIFRPVSSFLTVVVIISATAAALSEILRTNRFLKVNTPLWRLLLSDKLVSREMIIFDKNKNLDKNKIFRRDWTQLQHQVMTWLITGSWYGWPYSICNVLIPTSHQRHTELVQQLLEMTSRRLITYRPCFTAHPCQIPFSN